MWPGRTNKTSYPALDHGNKMAVAILRELYELLTRTIFHDLMMRFSFSSLSFLFHFNVSCHFLFVLCLFVFPVVYLSLALSPSFLHSTVFLLLLPTAPSSFSSPFSQLSSFSLLPPPFLVFILVRSVILIVVIVLAIVVIVIIIVVVILFLPLRFSSPSPLPQLPHQLLHHLQVLPRQAVGEILLWAARMNVLEMRFWPSAWTSRPVRVVLAVHVSLKDS